MSRGIARGVVSLIVVAACLVAGPRATSQDIPTLSVDVKVINVLATVRNKHGDIVRNLTRDDFTLSEDGRPQTIKYFSQQSDLPLTLGLLVDTSTSQRRVLGEERDASVVFLDQLLRVDRDNAFVIHFDFDVELLQDLTSSRRKLRAALDELEMPERGGWRPGGGIGRGGRGRRGGGGGGWGRRGGTALYDSVFLASDELMRRQSGRKAVIILSDGVDTGSKVSLSDAVEAAQRADTIVYSILFSDRWAYGGGFIPLPGIGLPNGKKVLQRLSRETGGRFYEVSNDNSIRQIYASIQEELRNQYNVGYSSDKPYDGTYRKIALKAKSKDLVVQAREGYYARN